MGKNKWFEKLKQKTHKRRVIMEFKLIQEYVFRDVDQQNDPSQKSPELMTEFLVHSALNARFQQTSDPDHKRAVTRIKNAVTRAIKTGHPVTEFTQEQWEFLLNTLKEWKVPGPLIQWETELEDYMAAELAEVKKKAKAQA